MKRTLASFYKLPTRHVAIFCILQCKIEVLGNISTFNIFENMSHLVLGFLKISNFPFLFLIVMVPEAAIVVRN